MSNEKVGVTAEEQKEIDLIVDNCSKEIKEILEKYNCEIDAQFIISTAGVAPLVRVVKKK